MTFGFAPEDTESFSNYSDALSGKGNCMIQQLLQAKELEPTIASPSELKKAQLLKLIVNAIINPLTSIFDCKNGQLFDQQPRLALIELLLQEAGAVVRKMLPMSLLGADSFSDNCLMELVQRVADKTSKNTSSMLQDIRAGRQTEIDYINGYIVSRGKIFDLPCPNNARLIEMVKQKQVIENHEIPDYFT